MSQKTAQCQLFLRIFLSFIPDFFLIFSIVRSFFALSRFKCKYIVYIHVYIGCIYCFSILLAFASLLCLHNKCQWQVVLAFFGFCAQPASGYI